MDSQTINQFQASGDDSSVNNSASQEICRICFEHSSDLISVCKCEGSIKFVHEKCIKTWVETTNKDVKGAVCELCSTKLVVSYKVSKECSVRRAFGESIEKTFLGFIALVLLAVTTIVTIVQSENISEMSGTDKITRFIIIGLCLLGSMVLFSVVVYYFWQAFITKDVVDLRVLPKTFGGEESVICSGPSGVVPEPDVLQVRKLRANTDRLDF